jgi:hypothetical protein
VLATSAEVLAGAPSRIGTRVNRLCYEGCHAMTLVKLGEPVQHFDMRTRTKTGRAVWLDIGVLEAPSSGPGGALAVPPLPRRHRREGASAPRP